MDVSSRVEEISVNDVLPSRFQPRILYDENELIDLSDSIKKYGIIQPLIVRKIGTRYEIIAGERRYKASVLAGNDTVPVIVKEIGDKESFELALAENVQRKNLSAIEEALSYKKILDDGKITVDELSKRIGKNSELIDNKIKLLNLSDEVQDALINKKISEGHARSLLKLKTNTQQNNLLEKIINERLTVRYTDEEIDKILKNKEGKEPMNNDANFLFNSSQDNNNFNIFSTNNSKDNVNNTTNDLFSTEPAAPTFINNNAPILTQVSEENVDVVNKIDSNLEEKNDEPMFVLFDDNNSPQDLAENEINSPVEQSQNNEAQEQENLDSNQNDSNSIFNLPSSENTDNIFNVNNSDSKKIDELENITLNANNPEKSPIIISDYNKQFDPVMPNSKNEEVPKVDMRSIINMIRNCQKEIENSGYEIELDEYDLVDSYQVTFKIVKK